MNKNHKETLAKARYLISIIRSLNILPLYLLLVLSLIDGLIYCYLSPKEFIGKIRQVINLKIRHRQLRLKLSKFKRGTMLLINWFS